MAFKRRAFAGMIASLALVLNLGGCAQTQSFLQEDSAAVKQNESMGDVDFRGAGASTDWSLYMDEEGGGP
jgi:hypothetical protein